MKKILEIKNLSVEYFLENRNILALQNVNIDLFENEVIGIIGESASGKSTLGHAIISLLDKSAKITNGQILFENENLLNKKEKELQKIRGKKISIIFQDPFSSLNPTMKIGKQILEAIDINPSKEKVFALLKDVGIQDEKLRYSQYPHQISGGMRQRVMIAIAIACRPKIIIADEPTTSLDTTYQLQIIDLLKDINKKYKSSIIFISHNIALVSNIAKKLYIMNSGKIIEEAFAEDILEKAKHPFTKLLLNSLIKIDKNEKTKKLKK
ncbi:MAG: Oligopeptide transport ATP-binding protein OppD [Candidatus Anoxychlamydiales bacterium]|uniref:ABC transporter domain-containing protein n=1 Tax=marine sediment metagenome TaxID=412755 RepID=A0A0F9Q036_9ZZZZ|nr:Oligopeptide transport ATP-binding protein OppD [Candidatus Anoxychlamydiales bacterium]NGX41574.1 Oligopeptide transport ATP-binding protein OppD [Candidatus Anoxychlamydiales bacterium]HEU63921.1 ABC transporter ATP-binding protein [Chlamydiota bacterium]